jgi:photosystem II stability/assembly factor-like uncharacterized protein
VKHRYALLVAALFVALAAPSSADASPNQWHVVHDWVGLTPMEMTSLPGHPGSLYLASYLNDFFQSSDGGATWAVSTTPPCDVATMAVDPTTPSRIYIGCWHGGMLKSTDGGATWAHDNVGLTVPGFESQDAPMIEAIAIDPADTNTVYATTSVDELGADVFVSHDAGDSWSPIHSDPNSVAVGLAVSGGRIYAYADGGVITSDDDGTTWSAPKAADGSKRLVADPDAPGTVYAFAWPSATADQGWITTDGGQTWTQLTNAPANIISASIADGDIYIGTLTGVYQSTDQGQTWTQSETTLKGQPLQGFVVAADPANPGHVWVAGDRGGLWELTFDENLTAGSFPYYSAGTLPATDLTATSAVLHGTIAGGVVGDTVQYQFNFGTSSAFGQSTPIVSMPAMSDTGVDSDVAATLAGLQPNTTYHYQLWAYSTFAGINPHPDDVTFTTSAAVSPSITTTLTTTLRHALVPDTPVPVAIHWRAHAGTYPLCPSTLQLSTDAGTFYTIAHPAAAARGYDAALDPGHAYALRVRADDCHGMQSAWDTTSFTLRRPATTPPVMFGSAWTVAPSGLHITTKTGARATLTFTGREIGIIALRGYRLGKVAVSLDGERIATLNLHALHPAQRRLVFRTPVDTAGKHTLVIRVLASRPHALISLDSLAVIH